MNCNHLAVNEDKEVSWYTMLALFVGMFIGHQLESILNWVVGG